MKKLCMFKDFVFHFRLKICIRTKQLCISELAAFCLERISRFGVSRTVNFLSHLKRMFWRSAVMGHALRRHQQPAPQIRLLRCHCPLNLDTWPGKSFILSTIINHILYSYYGFCLMGSQVKSFIMANKHKANPKMGFTDTLVVYYYIIYNIIFMNGSQRTNFYQLGRREKYLLIFRTFNNLRKSWNINVQKHLIEG